MYGINMQLMRSKHILFGLMCLIVVLWAEAQHGDIEIIDSLPPQGAAGMLASFDMPLMSLHLNGTRLRFNPRPRPGAPYDMSSTMWVQVTSIREYHRPGHSCGMDDGVLVNEIALSTCEHSYSEIRIEENGVLTTGYRMNLANCTGNERLSVSLNFTTANATTTSTYGPTLNGSLYDYFTYTSAGGGFKYGAEWTGWEWNTTYSTLNNTFLALITHAGWDVGPTPLDILAINAGTNFSIAATFGDITMTFAVDKGYILDGFPIINDVLNGKIEYTAEANFGFFGLAASLIFCEPDTEMGTSLRQWDHYYYDPSLVAIFTPHPQKTPLSPVAKKSNTVALALSISLPIACAAVIVTIILLVACVPAVRNKIMPYNRDHVRSKRAASEKTSDLSSPSWRRSKTPSPT